MVRLHKVAALTKCQTGGGDSKQQREGSWDTGTLRLRSWQEANREGFWEVAMLHPAAGCVSGFGLYKVIELCALSVRTLCILHSKKKVLKFYQGTLCKTLRGRFLSS